VFSTTFFAYATKRGNSETSENPCRIGSSVPEQDDLLPSSPSISPSSTVFAILLLVISHLGYKECTLVTLLGSLLCKQKGPLVDPCMREPWLCSQWNHQSGLVESRF
jgi:hypothetical protein